MNNEIKFRGKTVETKEWICGFISIRKPFIDDRYYIGVKSLGGNTLFQVEKESVSQFTGLYSTAFNTISKVQEAYYGDIIRYVTTEGLSL